jgi:hypothetical protein
MENHAYNGQFCGHFFWNALIRFCSSKNGYRATFLVTLAETCGA